MKHLFILFIFASSVSYGQLTKEMAQTNAVIKYHIGTYSYMEQFIGHQGYGAPLIFTIDGGGAAFGDGDEGSMIVKLDKTGKEEWKRTFQQKGDEMESQSVVQDKNGNYYVFMLVYDNAKYRGGCERMVFVSKTGTVGWDKYIGVFDMLNNPTISYSRALPDGRIYLRGHVATEKPAEGQDPKYHFWEGWMDAKGVLTQKKGDIIDWSNQEWQKKFKPE